MNTTKVENKVDVITNPSYIVNLPESQFMPSKAELMGGQKSVVVLPVKIDSNANFETGAVREISSELENGLNDAGAEIVDRSLASKLGDEILAYEATGQFSGAGIDVADTAILPTIHNVAISKSFSPASSYTDDDGKKHYTPAKCSYEAVVTGNLKLYQLPELTQTEALNFKGDASSSLSINNSSCPISQDMAYSLASQASGNGVYNILPEVQKNFSQTGYVMEYRKRGDLHLVNITLGTSQKLREGQKIKFATMHAKADHTTGKSTLMALDYDFEGVVSDMIDANSAWVIIDEEAEGQLKKGDVAKTFFEQSFMDQMMRAGSTGSSTGLMKSLKNSFN
ncbi:hypothetical protein [Alteromonas lipolytica]|uniref:Uncharacterized protein n=1 Tax=Alteromonas lipolytica TaxID=1856405 RepID=A0A1E8FAC0_9ALTE|nr:hypothetical protein [Alteromonas lipolytica]OFI32860.1 hypothetical protein BFC17_00865 [Alteromonas lipolytica]GGF64690.1 hypothetical protein GCM10011338_16360 [Alteromonas lipolytica]